MNNYSIIPDDRLFLDRLRGMSILRVVLAHLGLSWFYPPYSNYISVLLPILFFVSGAISLPIFIRAKSVFEYTVKRISSVLIPYYIIAIAIILAGFIFIPGNIKFPVEEAWRWLFIMPKSTDAHFPIAQVWFLRSLAVIVLLSIPIYYMSMRNPNLLLVYVAISIFISLIQLYHEIHQYFYILGYNLYQPLTNAGFFFFGSWYYWRGGFSYMSLGIGTIMIVLISVAALLFSEYTLNIDEHLYSPTFYYVGLSFSAILISLILKTPIQFILDRIPCVDRFVHVLSDNAYAIFILHSLSLDLVERYLNLVDVAHDLKLAVLKIFIVVASTIIVAVPVTRITKKISRTVSNTGLQKTILTA